MNANPSTNFDQARQAVSSGASMQSSFVAVPGASSSVPSPSMNFPEATPAPPPLDTSVAPAAQPAPPIPDVSMQAALPPTFDVNTTPFSSATTPPFPPLDPAPPPPPAQKAKSIFAKKWSLSRKVAVALMVTLAVVAVAVFFYSYFSRTRSPSGVKPSGAAAASPPEPKDITIHLAQGSVLELQGLKDAVPQNPGADLSGLKTDLAAMQKTLDSIDSNQKTLESSLEGWDDWQPNDRVPSSRKDKPPQSKGAPASAAPGSAPASRLAKTVRYSADLATQTAEADRGNGKGTTARWASEASTRFYGEAHSSPMHFSTFPSSAPQSVHV